MTFGLDRTLTHDQTNIIIKVQVRKGHLTSYFLLRYTLVSRLFNFILACKSKRTILYSNLNYSYLPYTKSPRMARFVLWTYSVNDFYSAYPFIKLRDLIVSHRFYVAIILMTVHFLRSPCCALYYLKELMSCPSDKLYIIHYFTAVAAVVFKYNVKKDRIISLQ